MKLARNSAAAEKNEFRQRRTGDLKSKIPCLPDRQVFKKSLSFRIKTAHETKIPQRGFLCDSTEKENMNFS